MGNCPVGAKLREHQLQCSSLMTNHLIISTKIDDLIKLHGNSERLYINLMIKQRREIEKQIHLTIINLNRLYKETSYKPYQDVIIRITDIVNNWFDGIYLLNDESNKKLNEQNNNPNGLSDNPNGLSDNLNGLSNNLNGLSDKLSDKPNEPNNKPNELSNKPHGLSDELNKLSDICDSKDNRIELQLMDTK